MKLEGEDVLLRLVKRISGPSADWIMLNDAFLYVWNLMNVDTSAKAELAKRLENKEVLSRALAFIRIDKASQKVLETKTWVDLPGDFWTATKISVDWFKNLAHSKTSLVLERATGIQLRRQDIFRLWPPPGAGHAAPVLKRASDVALDAFLRTLEPSITEKAARALANEHFSAYQKISDDSRWRRIWKTIPHRTRGQTNKALKSAMNAKSGR